jgi:hypothetical protein
VLLSSSYAFRRNNHVPLSPSAEPNGSCRIVRSSTALWTALAHSLRSTLSRIECNAFAFDSERIDLKGFTRACAARGHERRREAFFALVDSQPVAALLTETGGEGVNVFGLMNVCRMFWMRPPGPDSARIKEDLLRAAVRYYRAEGKQIFLFFDDAPDTVPPALGFEAIAPAERWLAHRDVMPAWVAYMREMLSPAASPPERRRQFVAAAQEPVRASVKG